MISRAALEWSNTDDPASITESYDALKQINVSLGDIVVFWKYHVEELHSAMGDGMKRSGSTATWSGSKAALDKAACTICASADAVIVNAIGAPPDQE